MNSILSIMSKLTYLRERLRNDYFITLSFTIYHLLFIHINDYIIQINNILKTFFITHIYISTEIDFKLLVHEACRTHGHLRDYVQVAN